MSQGISQTEAVEAISRLAGIANAREVLPYVGGRDNPHRGKVMAAITAGDGAALAAYCAAAVSGALNDAGLGVPVDARVLRSISKVPDGWPMVHDVAAGRENAAAALRQRILRYRQSNGQAGQDPGRSEGAPTREAASRAQEGTRGSAPPQARRQAPPPRRHDDSTVRQIGEARLAREQRAAADQTQSEVTYDAVKVHGGKAALTLEAASRRDGSPTIIIEAAKIKDPANRTYDWGNKIIIQLTGTELQHVTCLLYGMIDRVKFQNHGPANDKWFEIERQSGQYAGTTKFAVGQGREMCLVQLTPADLGNVLALFIRRCALQMNLEQAALYGALRPVAVALNEAASRGARSRAG